MTRAQYRAMKPDFARIAVLAASVLLLLIGETQAGEVEDPGVEARRRILEERILQHFTLGTNAPIEWFTETRDRNGARWDFRQQYFSGGAGKEKSWDSVFLHPWNKWVNPDKVRGVWAENFIRPTVENGFIPWITFYNLAQSEPALYKPHPSKATQRNAKVVSTMRSYWGQAKLLMQLCDKYKPAPIVVHLEPDEWGHLLLGANMDPDGVDIKVGATGMEEIADLPDNLSGYTHAWLRLRAMYAPYNVILVTNPSAWDWRNTMSGRRWVEYFKECGADKFDLAVLEFGDRDVGCHGNAPPYTEEDVVTRFKSWDRQLDWIKTFHEGTGLRVVFWQVAVGNTYFRTCNQTDRHYCDGIAQGLLEGYPQNPMIARYVRAGCVGFVFSSGQGVQTHVYDAKKDGVTNPEPIPGNLGHVSEYPDDDGGYMRLRAGEYYKNPYPILAKPKRKAKKRAVAGKIEPLKRKVPKPEAAAAWDARLLARVKDELAAGGPVRFSVTAFQARFEVMSVDKAGTLELKGAVTEMSMEWPRLTPADKKSLALAMLREGDAGDHCLAAFYLIVAGDEEEAEDHLAKGGGGADGVEASFVTVGGETVAGGASPAEGAEDGAKPAEDREPRARPVPRPTTAEEKPVRREADAALAKLYQEAETAFIDGDVDNAKARFEKIVRDHPESEYAGKAKEYLEIIE